jgi:hypothetical protein
MCFILTIKFGVVDMFPVFPKTLKNGQMPFLFRQYYYLKQNCGHVFLNVATLARGS